MSEFPEHDRFDLVKDRCQAIGEFLDWAHAQGMRLCHLDEDSFDHPWVPDSRSIVHLLADHFEIDLDALEREKQAMLARLREAT